MFKKLKERKFGCFGVNIKTKDGRGIGEDPGAIVDAMEDVWDELNEKLESDSDGLAGELRQMFNTNWPNEDDLGEILFGKFEDFKSRVKYLDDETQQQYTDKLYEEGVIDIELTEQQ